MLSLGQIGGDINSDPFGPSLTSSHVTSTGPGFESELRTLCLDLRSNFSCEDWAYFESSLTPVRLGFFLENEQVKSFVHRMLTKHPSRKDKEKAMTLKNAGNKAFGTGDNKLALEYYTKCLAWMPHDDEDAAVVYANRSAAQFHLAQYSLSERDALLAFQLGYPAELHYKLYERLSRCCFEDRKGARHSEASKYLQQAIQSLSQAKGLDEKKLAKTRSTLETLQKSGPTKSSSSSAPAPEQDNISFGRGSSSGTSNGDTEQHQPQLPEVVGGSSKYLKACSKGLTLKSNANKGRFVVANEAFRPGDVILVEKAYVSVLLPQHYHLQCFQCYLPLESPVLCKSCIYVSYCSTACLEKAWKSHHQYECGVLGALKHAGISVICYMAMRILTQMDPKQVLQWYNLVTPRKKADNESSGQNGEKTSPLNQNNSKPGVTEEYKTDHTALFQLVTHFERRSAEADFHQVLMVAYLVNLLKSTTYFAHVMDGTKLTIGEVSLKIGLVLHRCLQFLQFNTHETSGWDPDLAKDNSIGLGGGLFPTLALFNHSCNPAIVRYFVNDTVVVRVVRSIRPGEEITENYGPCFTTTGRSERQRTLLDQFCFECECAACVQDWPTFDNLANNAVRFRCEHCGAYICQMDENMGLLFKCGRCAKQVNILKSLKSLQESESKYKQALDFIQKGDESNGLGILLDNIALLERHLMPPLRDLHICQEHVRKCLLNCGNRISKLMGWDPEKV